MRILLVCGYFPPRCPISGTRMAKLAKFLVARGHDVRVLTAGDLDFAPLLPVEIPEARIVRTPSLDVDAPLRLATRLLRRRAGPAADDAARPAASGGEERPPSLAARLGRLYRLGAHFPDPNVGWWPLALRGARALGDWRPDVVYGSSPPETSIIVASRLARRWGRPWVAEFRDLWMDHPYYHPPAWRRRLEDRMERWAVANAAALVTVSPPWAEVLRAKYAKPVAVVYNGFDADDFPADSEGLAPLDAARLTLVYTGVVYAGKRDPSALFEALRRLGEPDVRVAFYGDALEGVAALARRYGVAGQVGVHAAVPYAEAVALQRRADALVLLRWNDPGEVGVVPGKLFEYLGARRPILCLGPAHGTVAEIVRERAAGVVTDDPDTIAATLAGWLAVKRRDGRLAPLPLTARAGFSRAEQFARLETLLSGLVAEAGEALPAAAAPAS